MMKAFYVSVIDGERKGLLLGPLNTHAEALDLVPAVRSKANELEPRAAFYAFGTASIDLDPGETAPSGKLNQFFTPLYSHRIEV
jgi:acetyl-CoA acetyltransferase